MSQRTPSAIWVKFASVPTARTALSPSQGRARQLRTLIQVPGASLGRARGYSELSKPHSRATVPPHLREIDDPPFVAIQGGLLRQQLAAVPPSGLAQLRGKGAIGAQPKCLTK
jgi:hypothetical protein